jgi:hypothetical protein
MKIMKCILLTLLTTAGAQASHECRDYAKNKATKLVELFFCESYIENCHVKKDQIKINDFVELQSAPSMDSITLVFLSVQQ